MSATACRESGESVGAALMGIAKDRSAETADVVTPFLEHTSEH